MTELCYFLVSVTNRMMYCIHSFCNPTLTKAGGDSLRRLDDSQTLPYLEVNSLWLQQAGRCVARTHSSSRHTDWLLISSKRQHGWIMWVCAEPSETCVRPDIITPLWSNTNFCIHTQNRTDPHEVTLLDCVIKIHDMHGGLRVNYYELTQRKPIYYFHYYKQTPLTFEGDQCPFYSRCVLSWWLNINFAHQKLTLTSYQLLLLGWKFHIYSLGTSWFSVWAAPAGPNTQTELEPDVCERINIMFLCAVLLRQNF